MEKLPVLVYKKESDLDLRIFIEHTNSLFKEWDRIAKALEVFKLNKKGKSVDSMRNIDSQPAQLIKIASFYYEAVKIGGDDLKKLLRRGRGPTGGKTTIFERLFTVSRDCGYYFKSKPSYEIKISNKKIFTSYIIALVEFLKENPKTTYLEVNKTKDKVKFLSKLEIFGLIVPKPVTPPPVSGVTPPPVSGVTPPPVKRKSIQTKPRYVRKKIPATLDNLIKECYSLDENDFPNAKTALTRVTFENTLKYVLENTLYNGNKNLSQGHIFHNCFYNSRGDKRPFTDFTSLKRFFCKIILGTKEKKAFEDFSIERPHQIIHNYIVGAVPNDAISLCNNLIPLLDFLLDEEEVLLSKLDLTKL